MKTVKLKLVDGMTKKILPTMPDGTLIPNIVKGSMSLSIEDDLSNAGYCKLRMEVYIKMDDAKEAFKNLKLFPGPIVK